MPLTHCPHCGAENFTMEGWEDLDALMDSAGDGDRVQTRARARRVT